MFLIVLCIQVVVQVLCEAPPAPPQNIQVENWQLTWSPATEGGGVTYSVQYSRFDEDEWMNVPACVRISSNACDVTSTKAKDEQGCVKLRVQAERRDLRSVQVEACSRHGDTCTPHVDLTPRPGRLTVHLSRNHSLAQEHGDHAKHRVYYGKEGEPLTDFQDNVSTVFIEGLQEGQRYCIKVQYLYYDNPVGLPSCVRCERIPESKKETSQTGMIVGVVVCLVLIVVIVVFMYNFIFGRVKEWLRPPCKIPEDFLHVEAFPERLIPGPSDEPCDVISSITPLHFRD